MTTCICEIQANDAQTKHTKSFFDDRINTMLLILQPLVTGIIKTIGLNRKKNVGKKIKDGGFTASKLTIGRQQSSVSLIFQ